MGRAAWSMTLLALATQSGLAAEPAAASGPTEAAAPATEGGNGSSVLQYLGVDTWSDIFRLGSWNTMLDLEVEGNLQRTQAPDEEPADFLSRYAREGLSIANNGFSLVDPRLLTGDFGVRFAFVQGRQDVRGVKSSQSGDITDYYFDATLLQELPYNLSFLANHSEDVTSQPGGGSTAGINSSQGLTFRWREDSFLRDREILPYFSATLQARQEHTQQVTTTAGQSFRRDEQRRLVRLDGHNGFETGDLYFRFEDMDLENRFYPAGSYRSRYVDLGYGVDFGPNLNRQSNTHINYNERLGAFSASNLYLDQRFDVEHTDFLSSSYLYAYQRQESPDGTTATHIGDVGIHYMPFLNVQTSLDVFGSKNTLPTGTIDTKGAYADVRYDHGLPWGGALSASLGGGLRYNDTRLQSSLVPVIDAPYQAPPEFGAGANILLKDSFIEADSIVVVDVRDGARLPTAANVDYTVVVEGSQTRIVPLATSAVILPGDPLEVSYRYVVDPSLESRTNTRSMILTADWTWIAFALTHDETRQVPLSGQETTRLGSQDRDAFRVDLRGERGAMLARADGTVSRYRDTFLVYDELRVGGHLNYRASYRWLLNLDGSLTNTDFVLTGRQSRQRGLRFGANWSSETGWWGDGYLSYRTLRDTQVPSETVTEAVVKLRRKWTALDFSASLGLGERTRGGVQSRYVDIHLTAIRQF